MRLDKFLKVSRLVKQRPRAKTLCDAGSVKVNGTTARAGKQICEGDELEVIVGNRKLKVVVIEIPQGNVSKSRAVELIDIKEEIMLDEQW